MLFCRGLHDCCFSQFFWVHLPDTASSGLKSYFSFPLTKHRGTSARFEERGNAGDQKYQILWGKKKPRNNNFKSIFGLCYRISSHDKECRRVKPLNLLRLATLRG